MAALAAIDGDGAQRAVSFALPWKLLDGQHGHGRRAGFTWADSLPGSRSADARGPRER